MPKISVLPKQLAELIAAGEVVEKPASVIKELTENAIDAGATSLTVEIKNGGIMFMRVTDNGCGIKKEDVKTAFLRHATSKIVKRDDLDSITTLGFRGEALAAICAVSKVEMLTRTENEEGVRYCIEGGKETAFDDVGCPIGTTIIVRDLFYNTPARMKFLHKDVYEGNLVGDVVEKIALSHPEIAVRFIRDGKTIFTTSGDCKLSSAVYSVLGREFSSGLIETDFSLNNISVKGFVCKPIYCRPKRNAQYFFLNGRTVRSSTMVAALEAAYKNASMVGKFPSCVLHIELPADTVDVNVHPAKTEVRFSNEKPLFDAIYVAVKNALQKGDTRPVFTEKKQLKFSAFERMTAEDFCQTVIAEPKVEKEPYKSEFFENPVLDKPIQNTVLRDYNPLTENTVTDIKKNVLRNDMEEQKIANSPTENFENNCDLSSLENVATKSEEVEKPLYDDLRYVGELFKTYIIVETGDSSFFIDKHAAHERVIFEELKSCAKHESQSLLLPVTVRLSAAQYNAVLDNTHLLTSAGFEVEDFGSMTVIVRAVPSALTSEDVSDIILEVSDNLSLGNGVETEKLDHIYHTVSCKAAIKAGYNTPVQEQLYLAQKVLNNDDIRYCPHGRPVAFEMKRRDFEKQFGRIQQ